MARPGDAGQAGRPEVKSGRRVPDSPSPLAPGAPRDHPGPAGVRHGSSAGAFRRPSHLHALATAANAGQQPEHRAGARVQRRHRPGSAEHDCAAAGAGSHRFDRAERYHSLHTFATRMVDVMPGWEAVRVLSPSLVPVMDTSVPLEQAPPALDDSWARTIKRWPEHQHLDVLETPRRRPAVRVDRRTDLREGSAALYPRRARPRLRVRQRAPAGRDADRRGRLAARFATHDHGAHAQRGALARRPARPNSSPPRFGSPPKAPSGRDARGHADVLGAQHVEPDRMDDWPRRPGGGCGRPARAGRSGSS